MTIEFSPDISHVYGPLIELPNNLSAVFIHSCVKDENCLAQVTDPRPVKYVRVVADQESFVKDEMVFNMCMLGGLEPYAIHDLPGTDGPAARKYTTFSPDPARKKEDGFYKPEELGDYLKQVARISDRIIAKFKGRIIPENHYVDPATVFPIPGFKSPVRIDRRGAAALPAGEPIGVEDDCALPEPPPRKVRPPWFQGVIQGSKGMAPSVP